MLADLERWIKFCLPCAKKKRDVHHSNPPFLLIAFSGTWKVIASNCMGPFLTTNSGNWYILIISDLFTKYIETTALPSIETAIITLVLFEKNCISTKPTSQIFDWSWNKFYVESYEPTLQRSKYFQDFYIKLSSSIDGFVERINEFILQVITMFVASEHKDWDTYLPSAMYA